MRDYGPMTISAPDLHWPARDADERAMLEGYLEAYRVLGHADMIRESIDGSTGD